MHLILLEWLLVCLTIAYGHLQINADSQDRSSTVRIDFGSCVVPGFEQPLWKDIVSRNPELFIFTGDATYLDIENFNEFFTHPFGLWTETTMNPILHFFNLSRRSKITDASKYAQTWHLTYANEPYLDQLISNNYTQIIGIYDDHDYGYDNGDGFNPHKQLTRKLFIDFLVNLAKQNYDSKKYTTSFLDLQLPNEGLYYHYPLKINLKDDNFNLSKIKVIDIIVLDIHYFYRLEKEDDLLGSKQWQWLETLMNIEDYINDRSILKGDLILIVSGEQVLPFHKKIYLENIWSTRKYSFQRLLKNIIMPWQTNAQTKNKILFTSGDVHYGEINEVFCYNAAQEQHFAMQEITSSSMTAPFGSSNQHLWVLKWFF